MMAKFSHPGRAPASPRQPGPRQLPGEARRASLSQALRPQSQAVRRSARAVTVALATGGPQQSHGMAQWSRRPGRPGGHRDGSARGAGAGPGWSQTESSPGITSSARASLRLSLALMIAAAQGPTGQDCCFAESTRRYFHESTFGDVLLYNYH